jgi:hypothetical protein
MSWQQLVDIAKQNSQELESTVRDRPVACPNDGYPLDTGPEGELHCPFDGWVWDGYNHLI